MAADRTTGKQRGGFRPGVSGNPRGRPQGSRNKATLAIEALLDGQAAALTQKAIELALAGDTVALRICMDRLIPPRRDRAVSFALPPITSARDAADIMAAVAEAVAGGRVTPGEAAEYAKVVDVYVKAYQTAELDERVARVEQLSDAELMRYIRNAENTTQRLITIGSD